MIAGIYRIALISPFFFWAWLIYSGSLGADPAKTLNHKTGDFALYYLLGNLALGNLQRGLPPPLRFLVASRRFLGITTFAILLCHVLIYFTMEGFTRQSLVQIPTKLYLTLGFGAMLDRKSTRLNSSH